MADPIRCFEGKNAPINSHVFHNGKLIMCTNTADNDAKIYSNLRTNPNDSAARIEPKPEATLKGHDKMVTSVDIAPRSNRIVTCSQDRNAYVWSLEGDKWEKKIVLLRINRAATYVRWSPREDKFAVASGARCVAVCYFDEDNNWWGSRHLKKPIRSTVLSLDWHPNNVLLATGSSDMKARVFSAFIKGIDKKPEPTVWGEKLPFETLCHEFSNNRGGWVQAVAFSPSGDRIAFASHDATINISSPASDGGHHLFTISSQSLPFRTLIWANENQIVAAGYDCAPALIEAVNGNEWRQSGFLEAKREQVSRNASVFQHFRNIDSRAQEAENMTLWTQHQNTITEIRAYEGARGNIVKYSTCGLDGKVIIWTFDPSTLVKDLKELKI